MSIEKKCDNCIYGKNKNSFFGTCEEDDVTYCYHFIPKEELVRKDERAKNIKEFIELAKGICTCFDSSLSEEEINAYSEGRENTKDYIVWYYEEKLKEE